MTLKSLSTVTVIAIVAAMALLTLSVFRPSISHAQKKGGGGGGSANENNFDVEVVDHMPDDEFPGGWNPTATLYAPTVENPNCLGDTPGGSQNYSFFMPDGGSVPPNDCAEVELNDGDGNPNGYLLRDDIGFDVSSHKGEIGSVRFHAQDVIGEEGIWHESLDMALQVPVQVPPAAGMVLHVHQNNVQVWKFSKHQNGKPVEPVGYIAIGDLVYKPQ